MSRSNTDPRVVPLKGEQTQALPATSQIQRWIYLRQTFVLPYNFRGIVDQVLMVIGLYN
jgi:hypothetical protein